MLAVAAVVAFLVGLVLDLVDLGGELVSALMWVGLALVAAHLAFGDRVGRRDRL